MGRSNIEVRYLGPLAGAIGGLLNGVIDPGGVTTAVQLDSPFLQTHLPTTLAETGVRVDVVVVNAGRGAFAVARHDVHWSITSTVIFPDSHSDSHFLAGLSIFFTCSTASIHVTNDSATNLHALGLVEGWAAVGIGDEGWT